MDYASATLYGAVQGLTEFLPVSSSGHLALLPTILGIPDPGVSFDLAMHLGTTLAVVTYYRKEMLALSKALLALVRTGFRPPKEGEGALAVNLMVAMLATFVVALLVRKIAEERFRNPTSIAWNLIIFGILMWACDRWGRSRPMGQMSSPNKLKALVVGIAQGLAIFPGVSRSGATLTAQRLMAIPREEATNFSFLLSAPIIVAGLLLSLPKFLREVSPDEYAMAAYGVLVSGIVGALTIHFFLRFVARFGLGPYALYRLFLGAVLLYWQSHS